MTDTVFRFPAPGPEPMVTDLEGWVKTEYVVAEPVARDQLERALKEIGRLKADYASVNEQLKDTNSELNTFKYNFEKVSGSATDLQKELNRVAHVNRNAALFDEAKDYALAGGPVDLTTSTLRRFLEEGEVKCSKGLRRLLEAGVDPGLITFSSDGQGSLPDFDDAGRLKGIAIGKVSSLFGEVRDAVQQEGVPLATALQVITENPARLLKLPGKGRRGPGAGACPVLA